MQFRSKRAGGCHWALLTFLGLGVWGCGTLLGVDDYEVDPDFDESGSDDDDSRDDDSDDDIGDDDANDDDIGDDDLPPDGGAEPEPAVDCDAPVSGPCDNAPQCGCGDGENCEFDLDDTGATSCVAAGTVEPYGECFSTAGECPVGHSCIGGLCKAFCSGDEPSCEQGPYSACREVVDADLEPIPGFFYCARTCDPVDPQNEADGYLACGSDASCRPNETGVSDCFLGTPAGTLGIGCDDGSGNPNPQGCAPGLDCVSVGGGAPTCERYCHVAQNDCGAGSVCRAYEVPRYAAAAEIGYCERCDVPANGSCSLWPQCGCGEGDQCIPIFGELSDETECAPERPVGLHEPCPDPDSCGPGLDCVWLSDTALGVCTQFCQDVSDCPNPNAACVNLGLDSADYCLAGCDPREPTNGDSPFFPCGAGQACVPVTDGDAMCIVDAGSSTGTACSVNGDCAAGLGCAESGFCAPWCLIGGSDCTSLSASCFESTLTPGTAAGNQFGFCTEAAGSFSSADTPVAIPDLTTAMATVSVVSAITSITRVTVEIDVVHDYVYDLSFALEAPNGTVITLVSAQVLATTANMTGTRFDDAGGNIAEGWQSPYTGSFAPEAALAALAGTDPNGVWTLRVTDTLSGDTGTLTGWRLHLW